MVPFTRDPVCTTGGLLSQATIHKQAVATWKDLGSQRAATEYVSHLPQGEQGSGWPAHTTILAN